MKVSVEKCGQCSEERVVISMSRDEAEMLQGEWPHDPSPMGGDLPCPMMELLGNRLNEALSKEAPVGQK
jgi:hypothetical protein